MAVQTFQTARQFLCIFFAVIYPCDQTVLKSDPPSCLGKIISAGLQKFIYRIFVGDIDGACGQLRKRYMEKTESEK